MGNNTAKATDEKDKKVDELLQKYKVLKKNYEELVAKEKEELLRKQIEEEVRKALEQQKISQPSAPPLEKFDNQWNSTQHSTTTKNNPFYYPLHSNKMIYYSSAPSTSLKVNVPNVRSGSSPYNPSEISHPVTQTAALPSQQERGITNSTKTNQSPLILGPNQLNAAQESSNAQRRPQQGNSTLEVKSVSTIKSPSPLIPLHISQSSPVSNPSQPSSIGSDKKILEPLNPKLQAHAEQIRTPSSPHKLPLINKSLQPAKVPESAVLPSTSTSYPESRANVAMLPLTISSTKFEINNSSESRLKIYPAMPSVYEPLNCIGPLSEPKNNKLYPNIDSLTTQESQKNETQKPDEGKSNSRRRVPSQRPTTRNKAGDLLCPTCDKKFEDQIFQCVNRHSICQHCREKNKKCKICGQVGTEDRNTAMEKYITKEKILCLNGNIGCIVRCKPLNMKYHLQECIFKDISCPINELAGQQVCGWKGIQRQLASHFDSSHPSHRIGNVNKELCLYNKDIDKGTQLLHVVRMGPYTFLVHLKTDADFLCMTTKMYASKRTAYKWTFEFHMYNDGKEYIHTDACDTAYSDLNVFSTNSVKLPINYVKMFINENNFLTYKFFMKNSTWTD